MRRVGVAIHSFARRTDMAEELVTIATFAFTNEADLAALHLREAGIPTYVANRAIGEVMGNVLLQVRRSDATEASALLAARPMSPAAARTDAPVADDKWVCLECGTAVANDQDQCPSCGWTFERDAESTN